MLNWSVLKWLNQYTWFIQYQWYKQAYILNKLPCIRRKICNLTKAFNFDKKAFNLKSLDLA